MVIKFILKTLKNIPFFRSRRTVSVRKWFKDKGDKTYRIEYNLNENSIVFDLGGYEGQWASDIFSKYCCTIHIFEPHMNFFQNIEKRFLNNKKIKCYPFGISSRTKSITLYISGDSSSIFKKGKDSIQIKLIRAADFIKENRIDKIDLMKINIEGSEYDLLEDLIKTNVVEKISNIQVQFHDFVPSAKKRMRIIQDNLRKTHTLTYQYEFVWENWQLKSQ